MATTLIEQSLHYFVSSKWYDSAVPKVVYSFPFLIQSFAGNSPPTATYASRTTSINNATRLMPYGHCTRTPTQDASIYYDISRGGCSHSLFFTFFFVLLFVARECPKQREIFANWFIRRFLYMFLAQKFW